MKTITYFTAVFALVATLIMPCIAHGQSSGGGSSSSSDSSEPTLVTTPVTPVSVSVSHVTRLDLSPAAMYLRARNSVTEIYGDAWTAFQVYNPTNQNYFYVPYSSGTNAGSLEEMLKIVQTNRFTIDTTVPGSSVYFYSEFRDKSGYPIFKTETAESYPYFSLNNWVLPEPKLDFIMNPFQPFAVSNVNYAYTMFTNDYGYLEYQSFEVQQYYTWENGKDKLNQRLIIPRYFSDRIFEVRVGHSDGTQTVLDNSGELKAIYRMSTAARADVSDSRSFTNSFDLTINALSGTNPIVNLKITNPNISQNIIRCRLVRPGQSDELPYAVRIFKSGDSKEVIQLSPDEGTPYPDVDPIRFGHGIGDYSLEFLFRTQFDKYQYPEPQDPYHYGKG